MTDAISPEFVALQDAVSGRYSLVRELGRGGMGVVFLARDVALDRPVAIKLLPAALGATSGIRERFLREARVVARLSHPHIVPIHAVEEHGSLVFFVMGYIDGETLGQRVRRSGPLPAREARRVMQEVAWALAHAHAHGVVHRDVKPDNILLERESGRAIVTDFGIARAFDPTHASDPGAVLGTPQYMSPEQARGEPVDGRSDLYSLGSSIFFAVTGRLPFVADSVAGLLTRQATEDPPPVRSLRARLPGAFAAAVDRCLARGPEDRFATADALAVALREAGDVRDAVPQPLRAFVGAADAAGNEIGTSLLVGASAFGIYAGAFANAGFFDALAGLVYVGIGTIMPAYAAVRVAQLAARARELRRTGYGHGALRAALVAEERAGDEATEAAKPRATSKARLAAITLLGAAETALLTWAVRATSSDLILIAVPFSALIPAFTLRRLWRDLGPRRGIWHRLLDGRFGRALFRLAGAGLRNAPPEAIAAGEPTVLAIGRDAGLVFDALPSDQRARLAEVPALLARLQADALGARADTPAAERAATAAAALDALRLDLLKLRAGLMSVDGLTRDLDAARRVGDAIDEELSRRDGEPTPSGA